MLNPLWKLVCTSLALSLVFWGCDNRTADHAPAAQSRVEMAAEPPPVPGGSAGDQQAEAESPRADEEPQSGQLLIYTGTIVLAIYEVQATQEKALSLVEEMGGFVSSRSSGSMTARVPAEKFREAMQQLADLGDTLEQSWRAQDVSDEVRDLDIRLKNALSLRDRLENLLTRVETIEEALKIEAELERITLEIERIRGQLKSFKDRIAYSTIEVSFQAKGTESMPQDEFLLPFAWLDSLGLEPLLSAPGRHR